MTSASFHVVLAMCSAPGISGESSPRSMRRTARTWARGAVATGIGATSHTSAPKASRETKPAATATITEATQHARRTRTPLRPRSLR